MAVGVRCTPWQPVFSCETSNTCDDKGKLMQEGVKVFQTAVCVYVHVL